MWEILPQLLVNALIAGSLYAIASAGLALTFGLLKILNFAHGHLMMVGAYLFYFAHVEQGLGFFPAVVFALVFAVLLSYLTLKVFVEPFLPLSAFLPLITTIALASMLEAAVSLIFGVNVKSVSFGIDSASLEWGSMYITPIQIGIIASTLCLVGTLALLIHGTPLGRQIRALSENRFACEGLGVDTMSRNYLMFCIGTLFATIAGIMVALETNLQPTMGNVYTIKAFAAMMLGGLGNIWGSIVGSYILGLIENLSIGLDFGGISLLAGYKDAFAYLIILLVLLFRPQGLFQRGARTV